MILDLYWVPFHAMVVFGHDREFLFNPAWAYCVATLLEHMHMQIEQRLRIAVSQEEKW